VDDQLIIVSKDVVCSDLSLFFMFACISTGNLQHRVAKKISLFGAEDVVDKVDKKVLTDVMDCGFDLADKNSKSCNFMHYITPLVFLVYFWVQHS